MPTEFITLFQLDNKKKLYWFILGKLPTVKIECTKVKKRGVNGLFIETLKWKAKIYLSITQKYTAEHFLEDLR